MGLRLMGLRCKRYEDEPDKDDVLGADDNATKRTGFFSSKMTLKNRSTLFTGLHPFRKHQHIPYLHNV